MIGDVLASTIICEHLKIHFPNSEVHYIINEHTLAVVDGNPSIDKILLFKNEFRRSRVAFYRFLKSIEKEKYDVVIDVYCKLESNLISSYAKAPIKISYEKWYSKFVYSHLFSYSQNEDTKLGLAIENRLLLLSPIIEKLSRQDLMPKIYFSDDEIKKSKEFLIENRIDNSKKIVMIGILGSGENKSYPLDYLATLINIFTENYDATILFNYIPSQKTQVTELLKLCSKKSRETIREDVFSPSLREFLLVLSQCDVYIGNEGGASNMSKALGIPNFSIFSPWISKKAWLTFHEDSKNRAVHLADYLKDDFNKVPRKERKTKALELYQLFKPSYIKEDLFSFLDEEVFSNK